MKNQRNALALPPHQGRGPTLRWCASRIPLGTALLMALLIDPAWALDPHRLISQYAHSVWRVQDGFPRSPQDIAQTSDGYIWIVAGGRLLRFDGVRMTPVPSPTDASINSILGSRDGSLWIGSYHGLSRLKDGKAFNFALSDGGVERVIEDHAGTIWITRSHVVDNASLCRIIGNDLKCYNKSDGNLAAFGTALAEDSSGDIWFGCQMLCRWSRGSMSSFIREQIDHPSGVGVLGIATGPAGSVWAAMDGAGPATGVRFFSDGSFNSYVVPGFDGSNMRANALFLDRDQTLWIATDFQGLYHIHDGHADHYGAAQGLSSDAVTSIYEDREGNLWITTDKGLDLFRDTPIVSFTSTEGLRGDVKAVLARTDNSVLVAQEGALAIIRPDSVSLVTAAHGHPIQNVHALLEDHSGQVWLGIDLTLMTYQHETFAEIKGMDGRALGQIGHVDSLCEDTLGNIWAIVNGGPKHVGQLLRIRDRRVQQDIQIEPLFPQAHFLSADSTGGIWIGTVDGKLAHYLNGIAKFVSAGRSGSAKVKMGSFSVDSAGVVWGATTAGLYRWDRGALSVMDSSNGLPCSTLVAAIKDDSGALWLESKCGYLRISAADVANWAARPDSRVTATILETLDGADPGWDVDRTQPNAARSPNGQLWFIGSTSLQMIDPSRSYKNPMPPPVHVEGLVADGKSYAASSPITLPPLTKDLQIDYTALSFVLPQRMGFRYNLEGRDTDWQDPGLRRQAFYNDLRPGNYRFRVIASNNDGVWNKTGATLDFKVAAAWYQTNWFHWLCAIVGVLFLLAIYRLRVRQIAAAMSTRFDERLSERTRIARDLHDTFLQTIQGSKLVADDALDTAGDFAQLRQAMKTLSAWLGRATEEGRASLNSLRTSATEVNDLAEAFRRAIEECRIHSSMEVALQVIGEVQPVHPVVRDEVYRIGYEAIRNACVHSRAKQLWVDLSYLKNLTLSVRDNGAGMDVAFADNGKAGHFGLLGMRERAARIAAKLTIESSASVGTTVGLIVPGGIIYSHGNSKFLRLRARARALLRKVGVMRLRS
jgi:signal transduction histidine kinase/ligand-binding sensor domain-containing protein